MDNIEVAEVASKPLRPDARREITNSAYKLIVNAELSTRYEKTRRLQQARMSAANGAKAIKS